MTPNQVEFLKRLIAADRSYRIACEEHARDPKAPLPDMQMRGVEIGWINDVNPRTARSLEEAGIIETVGMSEYLTLAFLGSYDPSKPLTGD